MDVNIPESILSETTECRHNFSCLQTQKCGNRKMCETEKAHVENILFLVSREQIECPYRLSFGQGQVCLCPTHYYYKKIKKV